MNDNLVEVTKVECVKDNTACAVKFHCSIDDCDNVQLILVYNVSDKDYTPVCEFFKKQNNPKLAKDSRLAIILTKNIVDSYDPYIQLISDDPAENS